MNLPSLSPPSSIPISAQRDELSSFKNYQSQRFKFLRKVRPYVKRWVGLTGTPSSNGLMDLWAEIGILDGGERLGKFIGRFIEIVISEIR